MLRKELDSLKVKHKDMIAELKTYKDKVRVQPLFLMRTENKHVNKGSPEGKS